MRKTIGVLLMIPFLLWAGFRIYNSIIFDIHAGGHLKRAADANTVELATSEMEQVLIYLVQNSVTSGYTSVLYQTPNEDVGFWYKNLNASLQELYTVKPDATQLEKSNVLMKLRETLLDQGDRGVHVTVPSGISVFPHNTAYAVWGWMSSLFVVIGIILFIWGLEED